MVIEYVLVGVLIFVVIGLGMFCSKLCILARNLEETVRARNQEIADLEEYLGDEDKKVIDCASWRRSEN